MKKLCSDIANWLRYIKLKKSKDKEIKEKYAHNPLLNTFTLNRDLDYKTKLFWKMYGIKVNSLWQRAWISGNGIEDYRYITEDVFFTFIEPKLNRKDLFSAYVDKNNYDKLFMGCRMPRTILRNINGKYYDENYERIGSSSISNYLNRYEGTYILKPSIDSSGAKNLFKLQIEDFKISINGDPVLFDNIERIVQKDFLIQEFVDQHAVLKNIYPHSLNTFRIVTLRNDTDIQPIQSIVKFGDKGSCVDYAVDIGGYHCGVKNNGILNQFAFDLYYNRYRAHPYTGTVFGNIQIPQFNILLDFAKKLHQYLHYFDMASWDLAIDKNGEPILIELNLIYQNIGFLQINNGPLFGDSTEVILDSCIQRKKL